MRVVVESLFSPCQFKYKAMAAGRQAAAQEYISVSNQLRWVEGMGWGGVVREEDLMSTCYDLVDGDWRSRRP